MLFIVMLEVIIQQIPCLDTACRNCKILLLSAPSQWSSELDRTEEPEASLCAVRMPAVERHHYLQATLERIILYLQNVNCCWNSHQQPCFLMTRQFQAQNLE